MRNAVASSQRFHSERNPCPICGGGQDLRGDDRCYGYLFEDGRGCGCSNVESAEFSENADVWLHFFDADDEPQIALDKQQATETSERLTLKQLASAKELPVEAFEALGCRDNGRGVLIGGKQRLVSPKYKWLDGRSPTTDPLFPMPGAAVASQIWVTAGESDAVTLRWAGLDAYGITSGEKRGKSSLTTGHYRDLMKRGVERVTIAGDADEHGQAWMEHEVAAAQAAGLEVAIVDLSPRYDRFGSGSKDINELWQECGCSKKDFLAALDEHMRTIEQRPYVDSLGEVLDWASEDEQWLIEDLISRGTKTLVSAPAKSLKTYFMLHLLSCCSTGSPLLCVPHWRVPRALRVLLVEEEGARQMFGRRVQRVFAGIGSSPQLEPQFRFRRGFNLLNPDSVGVLIEHLRTSETDLVVLDPFQRITPGIDENSNSDMRRAWDAVNRMLLELPSIAVVVVMHTRKGDDLTFDATRGAVISAGEVDLGLFLKKHDDFERSETTYRGTLALTLDGREHPQEYTKEGGAMEIEYVFDYSADAFTMSATGETVTVRVRRVSRVPEFIETYLCDAEGFVSASDLLTEAQRLGLNVSTRESVLKHLRRFEKEKRVVAEVLPESHGEKAWKWVSA